MPSGMLITVIIYSAASLSLIPICIHTAKSNSRTNTSTAIVERITRSGIILQMYVIHILINQFTLRGKKISLEICSLR